MAFEYNVSMYDPEMLVFVDKTGADRRNVLRRKGYSIRCKPAKSHRLLCRGQHISIIAAISAKGLLDCKIHHESVNGDTFYNFVLTHLVAFLQPFNDHFLLPYSPDLNPIEETFSKVKTGMKLLEETTDEENIDIVAFLRLLKLQKVNWINDSHVYKQL